VESAALILIHGTTAPGSGFLIAPAPVDRRRLAVIGQASASSGSTVGGPEFLLCRQLYCHYSNNRTGTITLYYGMAAHRPARPPVRDDRVHLELNAVA
jgi:hypothetical protein